MLASAATTAARTGASLERSLVAALGGLSAVLAAACGIVLFLRRIGGGFGPLGGGGLVVAAALGGLLVAGCDAAARSTRLAPAWPIVARVGYLLALGALALPPRVAGGGLAAAVLAWMIAAWVVAVPLVGRAAPHWLAGLRSRVPKVPRVLEPHDPAPAPAPAAAAAPAPCPGHLLQRFERYELDGFDCLRGTLALVVPQGARAAHGHVGFCPAFRQVPEVRMDTPFDGVEAIVTAAEIVPWGVRIECRLDEPAEEPVEIPVDVFARSPV